MSGGSLKLRGVVRAVLGDNIDTDIILPGAVPEYYGPGTDRRAPVRAGVPGAARGPSGRENS